MTTIQINPERLDRMDQAISEGRVIRYQWMGTPDAQGRERACLLAYLFPEAGKERSATACPAEEIPRWLAYLTSWIDDAPSDNEWPGIVQRYASLLRRSHNLNEAAWRRLDYTMRRIAILKARSYLLDHDPMLTAIDAVIALLNRAISGDQPTKEEWSAEAEAATDAAAAAENVALAATDAAAATAAAANIARAARAAVLTATYAAEAREALALTLCGVADADVAAAYAAAANEMIQDFFMAWETEIAGSPNGEKNQSVIN